MRKNKHKTTEYIPEWDGGSYQTGAAKPPKRSNTLVAVLLVAVIFLGGLASAMGILNFRLLVKMDQQNDAVNPFDTNISPQNTVSNAFFGNHDVPAPTVPEPYPMELITFSMLGSMTPEQVREHMEESILFLFTSDFGEGWGAVLNEAQPINVLYALFDTKE